MISVEDSLRELILNNYKSLREFSLKIQMPYSTLDTILKRGVAKANILNILKICDELNISADDLANGYIKNKEIKSSSLNKYETTLILNFNKLNSSGKAEAIKRVSELTEINKYITSEKPTMVADESLTYEAPITLAAHDDGLTNEEKAVMDERIAEALKNIKR